MKNRITLIILCLLISLSIIFISCTPETTPTTAPATSQPTATPAPTATAEPNWWDDLGEPKYGGEMTFRGMWEPTSFDQTAPLGSENSLLWLDTLFGPDWTIDRDTWAYQTSWIPDEFMTGNLVESWEKPDPYTYVLKLHEGVKFQNKEPVNGRELTAEDVQYTYDRLMGTGSGFTEVNPYWGNGLNTIERVVAVDTYTVEFRLKDATVQSVYQVLAAESFGAVGIIPHEWVELGDTQNWETMAGSGPFILSDYQAGTSLTYSRNPDYWQYDERYPDNQLPYVDTFKYIKIDDNATMLAAMRTGQIDFTGTGRGAAIPMVTVEAVEKSNPEIVVRSMPNVAYAFAIRCDIEPFNDVNVRKAMQMSLDRETICQTIYRGRFEPSVSGISPGFYTDWVTPYEEWPAELQEEYSYNPEKARQLLADAGYPNGFQTSLLTSVADDTEMNETIKSYLMDIGIDMEINQQANPGTVRSMALSGEHEGLIAGGKMGFTMSPFFNALLFDSRNASQNYCRTNDTHYEDLVDQLMAAQTTDEAKQVNKELDDYAISQHWVLGASLQQSYSLWLPRIKGSSGENMAIWWGFYPARLWVDE